MVLEQAKRYGNEWSQKRAVYEADGGANGHVPPTLLVRWENTLKDTALWRFRPVVVHGDLAEENVLTAGGAVVALRGLSQAHVGDPAEDMAWVYSAAPVDYLDSIEDAYDVTRREGSDKHLRHRAELVSELSLARWLLGLFLFFFDKI